MIWLQGFAFGLAMGAALAASLAWWGTRRYLRKLRQAQRRAKSAERLAEIGSMTSGLAHEIKNPLSTIGLNAQLIAEGVDDLARAGGDAEAAARVARRTGTLVRETERLKGILADFLQFAGDPRLDRRPTDLNALVDELADFFAPECHKRGIRLRVDRSGSPLVISVDAAHLKQSLLNLLLNAAQAIELRESMPGAATPHPREIILKVEDPRAAGLLQRRGASSDEAEARIRVIDTGPGMAPDVAARIFEPYFTTKSGGSGLGLPTARRLIEAHDGRLDVHSELGHGTEFVVALPIDSMGATATTIAQPEASARPVQTG